MIFNKTTGLFLLFYILIPSSINFFSFKILKFVCSLRFLNFQSMNKDLLMLFQVGQSTFPLKKEVAGSVPLFPMPYDLPLTQFSSEDVPWFIDILS